MDKMNVISITSDLDALNKDMQDWSFLPMELKMRSNDECIRQYGMTVPSLYNKLKLDILKSGEQDIPSNIKPLSNDSQVELEGVFDELSVNGADNVPVEFNFGDIEKSRQLQQNPLIVIIDPTDSEEEVASKIASYNALTEKFKRLSDSYSFELYGFNVRNMYKMVLSGIWTSDAEDEEEGSNILSVNEATNLTEPLSDIENFESIIEGTMDLYNEAFLSGDILSMAKFWSENIENKPLHHRIETDNRGFYRIRELSEPATALPWYTVKEQFAMGITPNIDPGRRYLDQIKEAMAEYKANPSDETANKLLELGWNYEVDINPGTIKAARKHYVSEMNKVEVYDIRSFNEYDMMDRQEGDPVPVYFVIYDEGGIRLSLESDLLRTVAPVGSRGVNVAGLAKVFVTFVNSVEDLDLERFKSYKTLEVYDKMIRPDHDKEIASKCIDAIAQMSKKPISDSYHYNTYIVYDGPMAEYDYRRTDQIVDTLLHHTKELIDDNGITESMYTISRLKPTTI